MLGKIIKSNAGLYDVFIFASQETVQAKSKGVLRHQNKQPIVGDEVNISEDSGQYMIVEIKERRNQLIRPLISNIDYALVFISLKEPDFQAYLLDKYLAVLEYNAIKPIIIFTKVDLLTAAEFSFYEPIMQYYQNIGYKLYLAEFSKIEQQAEVTALLKGKIATVLGQTGVGKSTFLNNLSAGQWHLQTNDISKALGRGKHTTRIVELKSLKTFWIADTPGFSSFELTGIIAAQLHYYFIEFTQYKCKFNNCLHINEKICGVKDAVENKQILQQRYDNYVKLYTEIHEKENVKW